MKYVYLIVAIAFICIAHLIRVIRWELFIQVYEKPKHRNLIQALSVGFILNYILPYKLGDLFRAWFGGRKMKNGKALGLSTVIVDRYLDVVTVGLIFIILAFAQRGNEELWRTSLFYIGMTCAMLLATGVIFLFKSGVKRLLRIVASIFNDHYETWILQFAWALIWNFKDIFIKINKLKLVISTVIMWGFYLISYTFFALFMTTGGANTSWIDVFTMLFTQSGISASTATISADSFYLIIYMVSPLLILLVISLMIEKSQSAENSQEYLNLLPHLDPKERQAFLENYFSDSNREYAENYLKINQNISIIRDYSAGSNATTMLCMDGEKTFFRKYAFGADGEKLYQQIEWIQNNSSQLPLPEILRMDKSDVYCYYDMPYQSNAVGLFEYVHSMPVEQGWNIMRSALEKLEKSIYKLGVRPADQETMHNYVNTKVIKNINAIKNAKRIRPLQQYDTIIINGVEYPNLSYYEKYMTEEHLLRVFSQDEYATIHGDLTIENIICKRDGSGKDDFYIIDPNTGNVHDSPNLDYAKLLQSIHGGYEFLMSTRDVSVNENHINFLFTRSSAYQELHAKLKAYMETQFGRERTKSIYYHEIIHWLRLMPYKIEKDGKRALLFYAGMLMVMQDVINEYEKE